MVRMLEAVFTTGPTFPALCRCDSWRFHLTAIDEPAKLPLTRHWRESRRLIPFFPAHRDRQTPGTGYNVTPMARPRGVLGCSPIRTQCRFQSCRRESVAVRLLADAAGWTHGPRFESPNLVPTRTEFRPLHLRSFRWRCHPRFAIPESVPPLFVQGSLETYR